MQNSRRASTHARICEFNDNITADELISIAHEHGYKHTISVSLLLGILFALLVDVILS